MSGPDVWGPHGWKFIHYITLGYPNNPSEIDKKQYYDFFENLKNVIPCSICGNHYKEHLKVFPLSDQVLSDKIKFVEWGINMHNMVNKVNKKRIFTFEEGFKEINNSLEDCTTIEGFSNTNSNIINYLLISSLILFILIVIYKLK